jgi:hypothetical protein
MSSKKDKQKLISALAIAGLGFIAYKYFNKSSGDKSTSMTTTGVRGIRNNNPGNIRHGSANWQGMSATQTDSAFIQFDEMKWGVRAMLKLLQNYENIHGLKSIREKIYRWAPAEDGNNPERYIQRVVDWMNKNYLGSPITGDYVIDKNDKVGMIGLAMGMTGVEVYEQNIPSQAVYEEAWTLL